MLWLSPARRATVVWIGIGAALTGVAGTLGYWLWPPVTPPPTASERVVSTLLLLRWPALLVIAMTTSLFRLFDSEGALDPIDGQPSRRHRVNQRVLANTIEQLVAFVPAVLALAVVATEPATFRLVELAVALFCLGRVLFWGGYHVSPNARGLGFNMTFSTSVAALVLTFVLAR
ncbi:MAG: MAPEG family protein [Polyangiaceae bacterium]